MAISVQCSSCQGRVRLPDNAAGKRFRCPKCKGIVLGPGADAPAPTIRSKATVDPGFVDAPHDLAGSMLIDEPLPISQAAKRAVDDFNPFDSSPDHDEEEEKPKKQRYYQPKDDYNPFADPAASAPPVAGANPEVLFDFGIEETPSPTVPGNDLEFRPPDQITRRRRR